MDRLLEYLDSKIESIPELEETLLDCFEGGTPRYSRWEKIISANVVSLL